MQFRLFSTLQEEVFKGIKELENSSLELTPIENKDGIWFKREDSFILGNVCGAKARQANNIIKNSDKNLVVTVGSKTSPQIMIVAHLCKLYNKKCVCFTTSGKITEELTTAQRDGAEIKQQKNIRYTNVANFHAKKFADENDALLVPFGMDTLESVILTAYQVKNLPQEINTIVISAGSGLNLSGLIWGLRYFGRINIKVRAIRIGKQIKKTLDKYEVSNYANLEIITSEFEYSYYYEDKKYNLDPIYEAKCLPYLKRGNLMWVIGHRKVPNKKIGE